MEINKFELKRQIFHLFLGTAIVVLLRYDFLNKEIILAAIIIGLVLSLLSKNTRVPVIYNLLEKFEREEEIKKFPGKGVIFYFIGVYIALLLFPKDIAMASIMVLTLGDSVSHLYGLHYGKIIHPLSKTKFLEGTIAGFVAGFIGALLFARWYEAFFASLAAMVVEAIEIRIGTEQVDDNLVVPFVAGAVIWVIRLI
jgi:diacylglycerol kinase (CTP)